jgi:hypothetical protein
MSDSDEPLVLDTREKVIEACFRGWFAEYMTRIGAKQPPEAVFRTMLQIFTAGVTLGEALSSDANIEVIVQPKQEYDA